MWRLLHDMDSLFYKVFKMKYFPNCSLFEAKSSSGSFAWKSILWERHLIEKGARWRVGDGQSIRIFQDAWLPTESGKISSHQFDFVQMQLSYAHKHGLGLVEHSPHRLALLSTKC